MSKHKPKLLPSQRYTAVGPGDPEEIWKMRLDLGDFEPEVDGVIDVEELQDPYEEPDIDIDTVDILEPVEIGFLMDEKDTSVA